MMLVLVPWVAFAVFVVAVAARIVRILSLPVHLRWELYPVAHERNASYGGSFFEDLDWSKRPRDHARLGTLRVMVPEILLLHGVYSHNRSLWRRSYPFHVGLYASAAFLALLLTSALLQAAGAQIGAGAAGFGLVIHWLTAVAGIAGLALVFVGALALLVRRLTDPTLRSFSSAADLLNLAFFLGVAGVGLAVVVWVDHDLSGIRAIAEAALVFRPVGDVPVLSAALVVMASALFAYIPTTHMSHFFTKWFMYHDIRWDDRVNEVGSPLEQRILRQLGYHVSWGAPHIQGGGTKTWADVATEPTPGSEKK